MLGAPCNQCSQSPAFNFCLEGCLSDSRFRGIFLASHVVWSVSQRLHFPGPAPPCLPCVGDVLLWHFGTGAAEARNQLLLKV